MKTIRFFIISIVLCSIVLFSLSCTTVTKPKNPLIGKWELFSYFDDGAWHTVTKAWYGFTTLEFLEDGTFIGSPRYGNTFAGSYRIINQNRIEFKTGPVDTVAEFSISGDELTIQGGGNLPYGLLVKAYKLRKVGHSGLP